MTDWTKVNEGELSDKIVHINQVVCILVPSISGQANRSTERHDMLVLSTRIQLGRRNFNVAAPTVWNALPSQVCSSSISRGQFRAGLKTHLFTQAYTDTSENFC